MREELSLLSQMVSLRSLRCSAMKSRLEELPLSWSSLSLRSLDCSENRLHQWPSALTLSASHLAQTLVSLDLSRNQIVDVPASVSERAARAHFYQRCPRFNLVESPLSSCFLGEWVDTWYISGQRGVCDLEESLL